MQRYFVNQLNGMIEGQDAHHIKRVMRMKNDDQIIICDQDQCVLGSIHLDNEAVTYDIVQVLDKPFFYDVTIIQGLPKKQKIDFVSKYATIFGASQILFCGMDRSIAKLENKEHKLKRLHSIAKEAAELAHRFNVPKIDMIDKLMHVDFEQFDQIIVCDEDEKMIELHELCPLNDHHKYALIIGPEGGISARERSYFKSKCAKFVTLGTNIFPTEAASLQALSFFLHKNCK